MEKELLNRLKAYFSSGQTLEIEIRLLYLKKLKAAVLRHEQDILDALYEDFGKCAFDTFSTEVFQVLEEIDAFLRHLKGWTRPKRVFPGAVHFPAVGRIYKQPYGVVLVISPWNYPFMLAMAPLVGAVAAGNCVILKPSAQTPRTAEVIEMIVKETFPSDYVSVCCGGHEQSDRLLALPFDFIFFTGSPGVGKHIMKCAAEHLTPVVLELGGKSPCIVDATADLDKAAKRIVWGKFINAGQTCVAPDYLLVQQSVKAELIARMKHYIETFYYQDGKLSDDFPRIISERHFERLSALQNCGKVVCGGTFDRESLRIAPAILEGVSPDSAVMEEEVFGPLLSVMEYETLDQAIAFVSARPKPLALYYFSRDRRSIRQMLKYTSSGGGCINDTIMHVASEKLPFGGVGNSGMGKYHGRYSFDTFSNTRSILHKSPKREIGLKYPPHEKGKVVRMKKMLFWK